MSRIIESVFRNNWKDATCSCFF